MISLRYELLTLEECFSLYHTRNIACGCNADKKEIEFMEE